MLIGDVARLCRVSTRMLRHYDAVGLVHPTGRTVGGYREYSTEDVRRIFHVESLRTLGLSLKQIGRALEDPAFTPSGLVSDLIAWTQDRLMREQELLERLKVIDAAAPTDWKDALRVVELMRELDSGSPARRQQAVLTRVDGLPVPADLLVAAILAEPDPHVAGALRWALARAGGAGMEALVTGARSPDVETRRRAVVTITAMIEAPGAVSALADALGDPDPVVRGRAALALGRRGTELAVPVLVGMVVTGVDDVDAAQVLGMLSEDSERGDRIAAALAEELAAPTADSATRIRVVQALVELRVSAAQEMLRRATHDSDRVVALVASTLVNVAGENSQQ